MKTNFIFFLLFIIASSCSIKKTEDKFAKERDRLVYSALGKFIKSMTAEGYCAAGVGEGIDHKTGKQNCLEVTFDVENLPDIETARKMEVEALQRFLQYVNSEVGIENYVAEYPYTLKGLGVALINKHRDKGLFLVSNFRDKIIYYQDEIDKPMGPSKEIHSETFEEATQILKNQKVIPD